MKASFDSEQPEVKSLESDGKVYIWICLNGDWVNRSYGENEVPKRVWECDFAEIIADKGNIDIEDVQAHPEDYLDFETVALTNNERITALEEQNDMLKACLLELSEVVYG